MPLLYCFGRSLLISCRLEVDNLGTFEFSLSLNPIRILEENWKLEVRCLPPSVK